MYYVDGQIFAVDIARKSIASLVEGTRQVLHRRRVGLDRRAEAAGSAKRAGRCTIAGVLLYDKYDVW